MITLIIFLIGAILAPILAAVFLEAAWKAVRPAILHRVRKQTVCILWWVFLSIVCSASGIVGGLVQLLLCLAVGMSHCELAGGMNGDDPIIIGRIIRNIPHATRTAYDRIKEFLQW